VVRPLLNAMLYFPTRELLETPASAGLEFEDVEATTGDGERLHGWWVPAQREPAAAHVLLFHGNAGNIGDRVMHAELLSAAGFDVLLVDYRGYGRSTGRPSEEGTYRDARAALHALRERPGRDPRSILYLGESLGGAVALDLALEAPPLGLVLHTAFTSVRDLARLHYRVVPAGAVPDAYPSLRRIEDLDAPLLVVHGDRDEIAPLAHAEALYEAAPEPKRLIVLPDAGHNDLLLIHGERWATAVAAWVRELPARRG
jgi:uncharacterized protein